MSKPKPIQINIPNPCSKSWDEMTPSVNGRHCAHCDKVVTDFTKWTDKQLFEHFSQNINKHSCGRFTALQVNRPILPPPQPHSRLYRLFIGLGLTLLLTQIPTEQASSKTPFVSCYDKFVMNEGEEGATGDDSVRITGKVLDEDKNPIAVAIIQVIENDKTIYDCATNSDGEFVITLNKTSRKVNGLFLKCSYTGSKTELISLTRKNISSPFTIQMETNVMGLEEVELINYKVPLLDPQNSGTNTTITSEQIEKMPH